MPTHTSRTLIRLAAGFALLVGVMLGIGWLITHRLAHDWPFTAEDGVDRTLVGDRTPFLNHVTGFLSTMASTPYAIGLTALAAIAARFVFHRWRETLFLVGAVAVEVSVFLVTAWAVNRPRPAVSHLDIAPPTSSFPSGHTAAAMALYGGILLLALRRGFPWPVWLLMLIPLAVGGSRLYRGMHHPSDVVAGLLLGAISLVLLDRTVLEHSDAAPSRQLAKERQPL
jgi:membrane-associated phospholipid phosphatase